MMRMKGMHIVGMLACVFCLFTGVVESRAQVSPARIDTLAAGEGEWGLELDFYRAVIRVHAVADTDEIVVRSALLDYDRYAASPVADDSLAPLRLDGVPELEKHRGEEGIGISNATQREIVYLQIFLPRKANLKISTTHLGDFRVLDLEGNLDLSNYSGDIYLRDPGGAVSARTVRDGSITAEYLTEAPSEPVVMTTYSGDITLLLPHEPSLDLRMKTDLGELRSYFSLSDRQREEVVPFTSKEGGERRTVTAYWVEATLGGGGPLFLLQTVRSDIVIRRSR